MPSSLAQLDNTRPTTRRPQSRNDEAMMWPSPQPQITPGHCDVLSSCDSWAARRWRATTAPPCLWDTAFPRRPHPHVQSNTGKSLSSPRSRSRKDEDAKRDAEQEPKLQVHLRGPRRNSWWKIQNSSHSRKERGQLRVRESSTSCLATHDQSQATTQHTGGRKGVRKAIETLRKASL